MLTTSSSVEDTHEHGMTSPWVEVRVLPRVDGKWEARAGYSNKALCVSYTLKEAVEIARVHAKKLRADLLIQKSDGQFYTEASYRQNDDLAYSAG
ncbi:MAG TPA: DUF2188 domain-containing protein [Aggregatilineales bacterium]|nr:DUF2188 domain-containing protein [Aggregatilineales bacterium]